MKRKTLATKASKLIKASIKIERLYAEMDELRNKAVENWEAADVIEERLFDLLGKDTVILKSGHPLSVVCNFCDTKTGKVKNVAFRPARIKYKEVKLGKGTTRKGEDDA